MYLERAHPAFLTTLVVLVLKNSTTAANHRFFESFPKYLPIQYQFHLNSLSTFIEAFGKPFIRNHKNIFRTFKTFLKIDIVRLF